MATLKSLCALQTCRRLWVPSLPSAGGCPAEAGGGQAAHGPSRAPGSPAVSLQPSSSSPSSLVRFWVPFLPYSSHWSPPRTFLFAGHCSTKVGYRGHRGPCLTCTAVKVTMISEMQKCQGVQDQQAGGKWKCSAFQGEGTGCHLRSSWVVDGQLIRAGLAPSSPAAPNTARPSPQAGPLGMAAV